MKRFYKTFAAGRHTQYAVVDDGADRLAAVVKWTATDASVKPLVAVPYDGIGRARAKRAAASVAAQLAALPGVMEPEVAALAAVAIRTMRAEAARAGDCSLCGEAARKHFDAQQQPRPCREV